MAVPVIDPLEPASPADGSTPAATRIDSQVNAPRAEVGTQDGETIERLAKLR